MPRPKCDKCRREELSNVTVEIQGRGYKLCEKCFREYLTVDAMNNDKQIEFIRGKPPDSFSGKLWYWMKRIVHTVIQE